MTKSIVLSIILMIVGVIASQSPFGFLLAGVPSGWRLLNRITPSLFVWMPLIGWVIYFVIKFLLAYVIGIIALPIKLVQDINVLRNSKKLENYISGGIGNE